MEAAGDEANILPPGGLYSGGWDSVEIISSGWAFDEM